MSVAFFLCFFFPPSNGQHWTRAARFCGQAVIVTPQYVRDASGVLALSRQPFYMKCAAMAAASSPNLPSVGSLALPPSPPSSRLRSLALVCLIFFHFITNADQQKKEREEEQ